MDNLFSHIRTRCNTLSPAQKQIADFVLTHSEQVILLSLADLADQCSTSETTILRFLRKIGFDSYQIVSGKNGSKMFPVTGAGDL